MKGFEIKNIIAILRPQKSAYIEFKSNIVYISD